MDRCALFVDASYALADGAMAVHGTRRRDSVSWNHAGLLTLLAGLAKDRTGLPVLRCYWYETAAEGARTPEHDALAEMPGLKLRMVNVRPGRREGIETPLRRDLVTLAKNGAISDAFIASADEHLAEIVTEVQDFGLRVVILHISSDGSWTIPQPLRQECDDIVEISRVHLRPFVELVRGAEPTSAEELRGSEAMRRPDAIGSRGHSVSDALVGPPPSQVRALAPPSAALYASPDVQLPAAQLPAGQLSGGQLSSGQLAGDSLAANAAPVGQPAHSGLAAAAVDNGTVDNGTAGFQPYAGVGQVAPGQVGPIQAGSAQGGSAQGGPTQGGPAQGGSAQSGLGPTGPGQLGSAQVGPGQGGPVPLAAGYLNGAERGYLNGAERGGLNGAERGGTPAQQPTSGDGYPGGTQYGTEISGLADLAAGSSRNGVSRTDYPSAAAHDGSVGHGGPLSNGAPPGRPEGGAATGYHAQPPAGYATNPGSVGAQAAGYQGGNLQPAGAQPGGLQPTGSQGDSGRNGSGPYGAPSDGSGQALIQQNGSVSPGVHAAIPTQNGAYQLGPVQHGLSYQNGALQAGPLPTGPMQSGPMQSGPMQPGPPPGPGQADPMRGSAQAGLSQSGSVPPGQVGSGSSQAGSVYPAPVAPNSIPPSHTPMVGTVFSSQGQYVAHPQPGALMPARTMQPMTVPLPEAVQAAHAEGFSFGESVGRDAPGLWLDAVLARKPRMPSDLEARLLQGSALPIDSLLHDEVRHSLRRGFWDALEGARR